MLMAFVHTVVGGVLLYLGGEGLVLGSSRLAVGLGIAPLVVGLTVVAFGTSSPELAVTLDAALLGHDDIAVGNVVGSNICNIALILGLAALVRPLRVDPRLVRVDAPILVVCSLLLLLLLVDSRLGRSEGALLLSGSVAYTFFCLRQARRRRARRFDPDGNPVAQRPFFHSALLIVGGLLALAGGANWFVAGAVELAEAFGVSPSLIALTVVALGTSLPELATSLLASVRAQSDIAVGNAVGSSILNLLAILGVTSLVRPVVRGGVMWVDLWMMTGVAILAIPLLFTGRRISRVEGALLVLGYVTYIGWRFSV
jgi:cation:H+ antiporter